MAVSPAPNPGLLSISPYVPGRSDAPTGVVPVKLSANESPLGASPAALAALQQAIVHPEIYPEGSSRALRQALGEVHGIDPDKIVCGFGSDDILHLLAQAYLGPGDEAVMSQYGFNVYPIVTRATGAAIVMAPEADYRADIDALLGAVTEKTKIVFLANPNNPTGTCLSAGQLDRLHAGLRPDILFVLDSAYAEYVTAADYSAGIELVERADNVVMVRTFSKMGLAALRVGWMYGPAAVVDAVNRIRGPFNLSGIAQKAAIAALEDQDFVVRSREHNRGERTRFVAAIEALGNHGLRAVPSEANFVLVLFEGALSAEAAHEGLAARGYATRWLPGQGLAQGLRITIGTAEQMTEVAAALRELAEGAR